MPKDKNKDDTEGSEVAEQIGGTSTTTTSDVELGLEPVEPWDLPEVDLMDTESLESAADQQMSSLGSMIQQMQTVNQDRLEGKISGDVADMVRMGSAEAALKGGVGADSPAARNLQARDFGMTSMGVQEQGLTTAGQITQLQQGLTSLAQSRHQFAEDMRMKQQTFLENSRQFGANNQQDSFRTQIAFRDLLLRQDMFNREQNLKTVEILSNLVTAQANMQIQAASADIKDDAVTEAFNSMITNIANLLERSNVKK